ncbi:dolichyl-phosphate beta-glucosyltransferase [Cichlidogyrus casuarinus]|uniref:Dolichyl-phosphate beta-glucosyltransferase n=1 Tax=Cichlidogyrus casuarinus TaxID=1844966 RepID=A0ABD2PVR6_9PLAT
MLLILAFFALVVLYLSTNPYPVLDRSEGEKTFLDMASFTRQSFPFGLNDQPALHMSIVIPAYNEQDRLPLMMEETMEYLNTRKKKDPKYTFEVIIVDDGSRDRTFEVAQKISEVYTSDVVRVLKLDQNRGKGAAVRFGMLSARGKFLLFADADGATKFSNIEYLEAQIKRCIANKWVCYSIKSNIITQGGDQAVICGSRAHLEEAAIAKRSFFRNILMHGFHLVVWLLCVRGIRDTQCGFKLFSRPAARLLFKNQHVERWAFDVDILYLAKFFELDVHEVPVEWHEVDGSKIIPVFSWLQMAKDILLIRLRYGLGAWKIEPAHRLN